MAEPGGHTSGLFCCLTRTCNGLNTSSAADYESNCMHCVCTLQSHVKTYRCFVMRLQSTHTVHTITLIFTRHSLVRAKGEIFVLLLLFCSFFCQRFLDNPRANSRQILHAGVLWFRMCLLPFWGLAAPGGRKKGEMKFLLLWESMGNFCILSVFERYLSNACTDPHQILFV